MTAPDYDMSLTGLTRLLRSLGERIDNVDQTYSDDAALCFHVADLLSDVRYLMLRRDSQQEANT